MHNIAIPFITLLVGIAGHSLTQSGMEWYKTVKRPRWTPSGGTIGIVWTTIYVFAAISALLVWNLYADKAGIAVSMLFVANAALNLGWSYIFFVRHDFGLAVIEMCLLNLTNLILMYIIWPLSLYAALLLLPYFIWVCFATYLSVIIRKMNRR